jgi:hypothetical protein
MIAIEKVKMSNLGLKLIMDGINGRLSLMNKSARSNSRVKQKRKKQGIRNNPFFYAFKCEQNEHLHGPHM